MPRYNPAVVEPKWQAYWEENKTFKTPEMPTGEKLYVLDMFPYPSGDGLHVGHPEGYTATDIVCRFERMRGKSVLHPMGFDAFGLPAEEHAIRTNTPPREQTEQNIATFRRQLKSLGFSYDWDREFATTDVDYVRWTQWIFLLLFDTWFDEQQQKGRPISELPIPVDVKSAGADAIRGFQDEYRLAFQSDALVNWCPALGTVLANEEVKDGVSERGSHPVQRLPLRQWMLRITAYAERLIDDLDGVNWSAGIKTMQRDWIGRSTGAEVDFFIGSNPAGGFDHVESGIAASFEDETAHDRFAEFEEWKAERARVGLPRKPGEDVLRVYTTRPDTLFGATYMVIAPEHPFVAQLTTSAQAEAVGQYCEQATRKSDRERMEVTKTKTGVFTGSYAINPVNREPIPIWIADYVLISYGTGAIMAVPAHDQRDFEFAETFEIPIVAVVDPGDANDVDRASVLAGKECFASDGIGVNSSTFDGLATEDFKRQITEDLTTGGIGRQAVNYKLRDWLFSRQRFWGEPFPILHEIDERGEPTEHVRAVDASELPVDLPHLDDYKPHGQAKPPLEKSPAEWLYVERDGRRWKRETNTMPQWAGSCWYYLRFVDPKNGQAFIDPEKEKAWMPVDLYVGGAEHAVLHLLYARFWHKVLYDRGCVSTPEPFQRLVNQGMILGEPQFYVAPDVFEQHKTEFADQRITGIRVEDGGKVMLLLRNGSDDSQTSDLREDQTEKRKGQVFLTGSEIPLVARADKMSKSRGNVVNPDEIVREYGADALRLYEMFMGPLEASPKPWSMAGVNGVRNFLDRAWRMIADERSDELTLHAAVQDVEPTVEQARVLHKTIKVVTHDVQRMEFNTAIARMMEFVNAFTKEAIRPKSAMKQFVLLLSPYAPHLCEELWQLLGGNTTLAYEAWPTFDESLTVDELIEIPVSINGKLRTRLTVAADTSKTDLETAALADEKVAEATDGKAVKKVIVVPGRMVNIVVK